MKSITVRLKDAMASRLILERSGANVIFVESDNETSKFFFRGNEKKLDRLTVKLKANGIAPIFVKPYTNKPLKRRMSFNETHNENP